MSIKLEKLDKYDLMRILLSKLKHIFLKFDTKMGPAHLNFPMLENCKGDLNTL